MSGNAVARHFSERASGYARASARWPWSWLREREASAVLDLLGDVQGQLVLDLGAGAGYYSRRLLARGAARVLAVDQSLSMLAQVPAEGTWRVVADGLTLALTRPLGRMVAAGILEFVPDAAATLANARRLAAADTRLVVLVPEASSLAGLYTRYHRGHGISVTLFTRTSLADLARSSGWRLADARSVWPYTLVARLATA